MQIKTNFRLVIFSFFFPFFTFSIPAQTDKQTFNRARTYDVQHYVIRINFDRTNKTVFGDTTVQLKPLRDNFRQVELDAADLKFESVKLEPDNKDLTYRTAGRKIYITLDKSYAPADLISIRFKYSAKPKKGVYFVDALREGGKIVRDAQVWTQGEPEEAHHWIPSFDFPDDKATTEKFITVERGETAIGNGELQGIKENADGTKTFHYKMPVPHSTYLISFVVGTYEKISDSYKNIPLGYYMYPGIEPVAQRAYANTKDILRIFEELTGVAYPFNKYDQTIVANFSFGGMENITATTMSDTEIIYGSKNNVEDLVSHEIAHSWFGNLVTCRNWAELWLNEGFATFMEAAYREKMYGRADYLRKVREDAAQFMIRDEIGKRKHGLYNRLAGNVDTLFDTPSITYNKGGAVVHTLRETVGTENFWKAVNLYLTRHRLQNVETPDLQKAFEDASGMKLDWFFNQWVYGGGYPKLNIRQVYNPQTKRLNLIVSQTQKADNLTPAAFTLPLEIEITTANGTISEKIEIKKREETFSIKLDDKPTNLNVDRDEKIPLKAVKIQPITESRVRK